MILLDTHAAIWLVTNDEALGNQSRAMALEALTGDQLTVSAISFWEIAILVAKQRLQIRDSPVEQRATILASGIREIPLTGDIALAAVE